ncbi:MAG: nitroreductase family protein [Eubacterium sp.]|nr:nitroreductase family protein [Eubacterium sp.]
MEALKLMNCRKSVRSYTGKLTEEQLNAVLYAGQKAPVGMGKYETMHMTVIQDKDFLHELDRNAAEFMGDTSRTPLYGAPCLILISTPIPDPAAGNVQYSNAAIMAEHMALSAIDMGIGSCLIWGAVAAMNTKPELVAKLNLPEGHKVCCGIVVGETAEELSEREIDAKRVSVSYYRS